MMKLNHSINLEEDYHSEFKEIKGANPINTIKNLVDEYAVAYLNSEGGSIFFGIQDSDQHVVGVRLDVPQRDKLRKEVSNKLANIQPKIDPTVYRLEFHAVYGSDEQPILNLYVVQVKVPPSNSIRLHFTESNEAFVKTNGVKQKLTGPQVQDWIMRRLESAREDLRSEVERAMGSELSRIQIDILDTIAASQLRSAGI
ncbi:ATP-binding protein [Leptolyngbya sp. FACHB-261]|uniref:ATP-binding protein n=1 Tax=Leptolyngbya sp. FACHB-261 TaxID=2692806 RepID=UPI001681D648|nr:ATP-binding protein [Leptolyngbya sp. FACHB-261]MBD2100656.1 ATP-binding protein [Leptolyngbya sp. FACHB-261]